MLTTTDAIVWLKEDKRRLSLFFEIEGAGLLKGPTDQDIVQQLVDCGLVKNDEHGIRLSEQGRRTVEGFEALAFLGEVK